MMRLSAFLALVPLMGLTGCATLASVADTADKLSHFVAPESPSPYTSVPVTVSGRDFQVGTLTVRWLQRATEAPDFWMALVAKVTLNNTVTRTVDTYELKTPSKGPYEVRVVYDVIHPDNGGDGLTTVTPSLQLRGPDRRVVGVARTGSLDGDGYLTLDFPPRVAVKPYFNNLPKKGGWADVLRQPTALALYQGSEIGALLTEKGPKQLLLAHEGTATDDWSVVALVCADLLLNADLDR